MLKLWHGFIDLKGAIQAKDLSEEPTDNPVTTKEAKSHIAQGIRNSWQRQWSSAPSLHSKPRVNP